MKFLVRLLVGLVSSGMLAAAVFLPAASPAISEEERIFSIDVDPLPLQIICPGPLVQVAGESGVEVGLIERIGTARIWSQGSSEIVTEERSAQFYPISSSGNDQSTDVLSAIQTQVVDRARAAGLIAGYCEQPTRSGWFVSGDGGVGRESVLMVANPNPVDTQLLIEFHFGGTVLTERIVLAAESERLISLPALVGVEPAYAIYFQSSGSPLLVALQHRYSDGLTPLGISLTTAIREAETSQWIAPLEILAEGYEAPRLRIFAPQDAAEVTIRAFGATSSAEIQVSVGSGELIETSLNLERGVYALRIESTEPVLAQVLNPSLTPLDYSWLSTLVSFTSLSLPLPNFASELALLNPGNEQLTVDVLVESEGRLERSSIQLRPAEILMLPVAGEVVRISSESEFMAALRILDSVGYEVINPSENSNPGQSLEVSVR